MTVAVAIDFGGTKIDGALVDDAGRLLPGSRVRRPTGGSASVAALEASLDAVLAEVIRGVPVGEYLVGAGIGCAGPVDVVGGTVSPLNVPAWIDYPLVDHITSVLGDVPVTLRLDGLCIALAEHWVGATRGYDNVMGMIVSTGIGGGLILNGQAISGSSGNAGHIGHIEVGGFDDPCACGGTGCVEAIASGPSSVAWARSRGWVGETGEQLSVAYRAGDVIAVAAVERAGRALGRAIASATALNDLDVVAIGGGFSHVTPDLFTIIRNTIRSRSRFEFVKKVLVLPSALSGDGPLIGAAALVLQPHRLTHQPITIPLMEVP
jgi:glucokinase